MSARQGILIAVLLPFLALSSYVIATVGFNGFYDEALSSPATMLMGYDLLVSLGLILIWMQGDAGQTRTPWIPYVVVTLLIGVAGPLGYLIHREVSLRRSGEGATARATG